MSWTRDKPIIGVVGFNLLTLLVFVTAPVKWKTDHMVRLCLFVLLCQLLVFVGFRLGRRRGAATAPRRKPLLFSGATFMRFLLAFYILTFPVSYAYRMEFAPFDIPGMVSHLLAGVRDPHSAYAWTMEKTGSGSIRWSVYFVISVFNQLFFAAGFSLWRRLGRGAKVALVTLVGVDLFYWVGIATTFGVVTLATTFGLSSMFWPPRVRRRTHRRLSGNAPLLFLLLAGSVAFFSYNLYRRSDFSVIDVRQYEIARIPIVLDHPALAIVPGPLQPTYILAVSYLSQGYYHTCFAFDLDFRWTKFVGNNPALIALAKRLGVDVWDDTYMHRLQSKGIDEFGEWHSAYTWFASDVTFYGVPVLLLILGYFFGFSWARGAQGDFLSQVVFIMCGNVLLLLFANNTYLSSVFNAFLVFVPFWVLTRLLPALRVAGMRRRVQLQPATGRVQGPDQSDLRVEIRGLV